MITPQQLLEVKRRIKDRIKLQELTPHVPLYFGDKNEILVLINELDRLNALVEKADELLHQFGVPYTIEQKWLKAKVNHDN